MNNQAMIYSLVLVAIVFILYILIWGSTFSFGWGLLLKFYIGYMIGIILHELIHAIGFIVFGKAKLSEVKFGFMLKHLTPYAHCKVPITVKSYKIALLLPVIVTGIIPLIWSLAIGNVLLISISVFLIAGGIGDWIVFRKIYKFPNEALLEDHPDAIGCIIYQS
ncbi:DUF3267 domain-containing protein [Bacillus coahuilensis]|nr:DUF3267 domain-containing protein [Bacillus coahuilensis]